MAHDPQAMLLWQDDDLLVVSKPSGLLSLPDGYDPRKPHLRGLLEPEFGRLWIVHRLDRETSGVVVLARNPQAHRSLNIKFEKRRVGKTYHALVVGSPGWEQLVVRHPLRPDGDRRHRSIVDPRRGKPAETSLRVLQRFPSYTLLEATPLTGRPHQVRAHLAACGHPVSGDSLYGNPDHPAHGLMGRLGLHARALAVEHPRSGQTLRFEAPYPEDFSSLLAG